MKLILLTLLCVLPATIYGDSIVAGRTYDHERSFAVSLSAGKITDIHGGVQETTRRLFEVTGEPEKNTGQESYDFNELGLEESELLYGIQLEKIWKYMTLRFDLSTLTAEASATPDRDFYIGVDEISFQGQNYTHQKLEEGIPYDAQLDGFIANLGFDITPFTLNPNGVVQATPWLHLGILGVMAEFEVDQGPALRLEDYENPPRTYVVGGHGSGDDIVASPEIGLGGEVKLKLGERLQRSVSLALQGTYSIFDFKGDLSDLGVSSDTDKDLDYDYDAYELRVRFEIPWTKTTDFLIGAAYRVLTIDASSKAKDRSLEETVEEREKFDKDVTLDLTMVTCFAGVRW